MLQSAVVRPWLRMQRCRSTVVPQLVAVASTVSRTAGCMLWAHCSSSRAQPCTAAVQPHSSHCAVTSTHLHLDLVATNTVVAVLIVRLQRERRLVALHDVAEVLHAVTPVCPLLSHRRRAAASQPPNAATAEQVRKLRGAVLHYAQNFRL